MSDLPPRRWRTEDTAAAIGMLIYLLAVLILTWLVLNR